MKTVSDAQRRTRIARRHAIAPAFRSVDVVSATRAMTVLHATEEASVHLALAARVDGIGPVEVLRSLQEERTLVRQLAMRRTLFVFPRDLLPAALGSASARVAGQEHRRLVTELGRGGVENPELVVEEARQAALVGLIGAGDGLEARVLREQTPALDRRFVVAPGSKWESEISMVSRILTLLGAQGQVLRGRYLGHWRTNRPTWVRWEDWLGDYPVAEAEADGYAELVRRWLGTFGPGTEEDMVWWLGATKTAVRRALADVGAQQVQLESGATGWLLADDLDDEPEVAPWAALLPVLDPTTMGWKQRDFYLDPAHRPAIFDSAGNAGSTAWWGGRIVGCWVQNEDAVVRVVLLEDIGSAGVEALNVEAERLTEWLAGVRINSIYASPRMRAALEAAQGARPRP